MQKWTIIPIILCIALQSALAMDNCKREMQPGEVPCQLISTYNYEIPCNETVLYIYNETPTLLETRNLTNFGITGRCNTTWNYTQKGSYLLNFSTNDNAVILIQGEREMSSLSITFFVMIITAGVFALPFFIRRFTDSEILNTTLKGLCITFGLFLLSLDAAMVATIADQAGLGLNQEVFRYLWIINWAAYISMVIVVLGFGYKVLQLWNWKKTQKGYGNE